MSRHIVLAAAVAAVASVLAGCASVSGLDADDKFACKAPDGVTCMSVSGIYANAKANNLPGQRKHEDSKAGSEPTTERVVARNYNAPDNPLASPGQVEKTSPRAMSAPNSGPPLRTPERILRVWLAPFEDQEGDLHDQKYFYVTVRPGAWTIEANRANIRSQFQQVVPLTKSVPAGRKSGGGPALSPQQQAAQALPVAPVQQGAAEDQE